MCFPNICYHEKKKSWVEDYCRFDWMSTLASGYHILNFFFQGVPKCKSSLPKYPSKSLKSAKTITACGLSQRLWESQADVKKGNTIWETDLIFCFYASNNSLAYWLTQK